MEPAAPRFMWHAAGVAGYGYHTQVPNCSSTRVTDWYIPSYTSTLNWVLEYRYCSYSRLSSCLRVSLVLKNPETST